MPMGYLDAAPKLVAMMMKLKTEWYTLYKGNVLKNVALKIFWWCVTVWVHSQAAPRLFHNSPGCTQTPLRYTKTEYYKWFQDRWEFLGMNVAAGVTQPAQSQNENFAKIELSNTSCSLGSSDSTASSWPYMSCISDMEGKSYLIRIY